MVQPDDFNKTLSNLKLNMAEIAEVRADIKRSLIYKVQDTFLLTESLFQQRVSLQTVLRGLWRKGNKKELVRYFYMYCLRKST